MSRRKKHPEEKHQYSSQEIVFSSGWVTSDFRLAEKQRQIDRDYRKEQESAALGTLYDLIETENIVSLAYFVRFLYAHHPQLATLYKSNHQLIRDYISSRRYDISCGFTDIPYGKVCQMLKSEQARSVELDTKVTKLYQTIDTDKRKLKDDEKKIAELKQSVYELQLFSQRLLERNSELLELLDFEELPK